MRKLFTLTLMALFAAQMWAQCAISECGNASLTYVIKVGSSGSQQTDGSDFIQSATPSNTTALSASKTIGLQNISISDGTMKAAAATNTCFATAPNMTGKIGMHNGSSYDSSKYLQFTFTVKDGCTFTPCDIQFVVQPVSYDGNFRWEITDGTTSYGYGEQTGVKVGKGNGATVLTGLTSPQEMAAGTYYIRLYPYYNGSNTFRLGTDVILKGTAVEGSDETAPTLSNSVPANGATEVAVEGTIVLTFSEEIASVDGSKFTLTNATKGTVAIDGSDAKKVNVPYSGAANSATVTLSVAANAVADAAGNQSAALSDIAFTIVSVKHIVTYYDGDEDPENKLGEEIVVEGENPTGAGLTPKKLGYTFGGWSTTNGGSAVALNTISVTADMPLYAVWNAIDCEALNGTIFTYLIENAPEADVIVKDATGYKTSLDLNTYGGVSGGNATLVNTSSNNHAYLYTDKDIELKGNDAYLKLEFDCALAEGDTIKSLVKSNNAYVALTATRPSSESNAAAVLTANNSEQKLAIVSESTLIGKQTIYIFKGGGNITITSVKIARPAKYAVTFNMHDHGDAVDTQYILTGGKVNKPATTDIDGWDFGGWYKESTYENEWNFATDVVNAATELHAKWTTHTTSSDATLSDLTVDGVTVDGFDPEDEEYDVELAFGTSVIPVVAGTANSTHAKSVVVTQATTLPGVATVVVTAEDNTTKTYTINFTVATGKEIELVWKTGSNLCSGGKAGGTAVKSDDASVSTYINQITFQNVEGTGDDGAEGGSLNVGKKAGNMFTLSTKTGYAFEAMSFYAKIQDSNCEYSLDGGDWTTLTSTSTSGDKCYEIFSSAEVKEFRLRSTGSSGVWIRNMELTIVETSTPSAIGNTTEEIKAVKILKNGQLYILRGEKVYTVTGAEVK